MIETIRAIIVFPGYSIYQNFTRYLSYDVRTEVRNIEKMERNLPVVTFCLESTFDENFNCYKDESSHSRYKCKLNRSKDIDMWYKDGKVWKQGKDAVNNCYIFNENGTVSLATEKQYQIIDFYTTLKYDLLTVNFQSTDEFKYNKELIYFS